MESEIIRVLGLATIGITVATTGAAVAILHLLFSPDLSREIDEDLHRRG
ncbi:MAG: hypothetical protein ACE14M_14325 [Terriglobales bacterium]